jgi:uncharacterized protein YkwD
MLRSKTPVLIFIIFILAACRGSNSPTTSTTLAPTDTLAAAIFTPTSQALNTPSLPVQTTPTASLPQAESTPTSPAASPTESSASPSQSPTPETNPTATPVVTQPPQPTPTVVAPTPTPSSDDTSAAPGECQEKAAFYGDVSVPDDTFFEQGATFTKTWRFHNEGTCTWTPDYKVVFQGGEIMGAPLSNPFPTTVLPGEQVDISIDMRAPTRGGPYQSVWQFEDPNGVRFGTGSAKNDSFWVKVDVRFLDQNNQPQPDPGAQPPAPTPAGCSAQVDTGVEAQVLSLINQQRADNGLNPLALNAALTAAGRVQSTDMACNNFISHTGSDGSNWADRIRAQGYDYATYPLENIYVGEPQFGGDAQGAVTWWMNSQVHRDNILNDVVTEVGVGYVYDPNSEYGGYYTMDFALPR